MLGMDLGSQDFPRLHSFPSHLGIRHEPTEPTTKSSSLLEWSELKLPAETYFRTVGPEFKFSEKPDFILKANAHSMNPANDNDFDVVDIFSFEYGMSRTNYDAAPTRELSPDNSGDNASQFVELADLLSNDFSDKIGGPDLPTALSNALIKIKALQSHSAFIDLVKADLAVATYRALRLMSQTDAERAAEPAIDIGKVVISAARKLLHSRTPWWNVVGAPFRFLCTLIMMEGPKFFALLPRSHGAYPAD